MHKTSHFFDKEEEERIISAIKKAEGMTTGEIKIHLECHSGKDVLDRASEVFEKLGMFETKWRTGVLFYLAMDEKQFAIIGDLGINQKVQDSYWDGLRDRLAENFKNDRFCDGLVEAIIDAGEHLRTYFPISGEDKNEISDEISYGE